MPSVYHPDVQTPLSAPDTDGKGWGTVTEIKWLTRLKVENPQAFKNYKATFYGRKKWRDRWTTIDPEKIATFLGLQWPPPHPDVK